MRRKMGKFAGLPVMMLGAVLFFASQAYADGVISLTDASGAPGSVIPVDAILVGSTGEEIAGTQNDIALTADLGVAGRFDEVEGKVVPDCVVNRDIRKTATSFAYLPSGCDAGLVAGEVPENCTGIRALVLSLTNTDPIAGIDAEGGVRLYTCNLTLGAIGVHTLACSMEGGSDPDGKACGAVEPPPAAKCGPVTCSDAEIEIVVPPTPTATATATTEATDTPTVGTATPTRTNTRPVSGDTDDDGCQAVAPVSSHTGWLLFAPAALLLWSRRRSR